MERLLSIKEVSEFFKVSRVTITRMLKNKTIPAVKIKGSWRFCPSAIQKWLKEKNILQENNEYRS